MKIGIFFYKELRKAITPFFLYGKGTETYTVEEK
jgi:hypothetical protein